MILREYKLGYLLTFHPFMITPVDFSLSDISNTFEDPLARSVRRRLRLEGVESGIP